MLSKLHRLSKSKEIEKVYKNGKSFFSKTLGIKVLKNNLEHSRFAVVVGLKVSKKATKRNRVKRQLREILRLNLKKMKSGFDVMVITLPGVIDKKYDELEKELFSNFKKLDLL
ncbi:MAG: ribonuclease P protein component [Patescibacteria group bacterium]|nr:ribonuclease P protein component [Patescibacteria group bacterium]